MVPGSPQDLALKWLLNFDTKTNGCKGLDGITQRYILAVFYYSTDGNNWFNKSSWLGASNECTWYGVKCTNGVSSLDFDANNLGGTLPMELAKLPSLQEIHAYVNQISGTIPIQLGSLSNLTLLDLENNNFSGPFFFPELFQLASTLTTLRGSYNSFSGSIPTEIGLMTQLQQIWISNNRITGTIPAEITSLTDLRTFIPFYIQYHDLAVCYI